MGVNSLLFLFFLVSYLTTVSIHYVLLRVRLRCFDMKRNQFEEHCTIAWVPMGNVIFSFVLLVEIAEYFVKMMQEKYGGEINKKTFWERLYNVKIDENVVRHKGRNE